MVGGIRFLSRNGTVKKCSIVSDIGQDSLTVNLGEMIFNVSWPTVDNNSD